MDEHSESQRASGDPIAEQSSTPAVPVRRTLFGGLARYLQQAGRDVMSVALGRLAEPSEAADDGNVAPSVERPAEPDSTSQRVRVLHDVAEKLRGAADKYIAVKLDEIEARVDAKLNHIEQRIDAKILELHEQLQEMRDRELRHRLRLLKVTLVFTVLVAVLSLGYKWFAKYWLA